MASKNEVLDFAQDYDKRINKKSSVASNYDASSNFDTDWSEHLQNAGRHHTSVPNATKKQCITVNFSDTLGNLLNDSFSTSGSAVWHLNDGSLKSNLIASHIDNNQQYRDVVKSITVHTARNTAMFPAALKIEGPRVGTENISRPFLSDGLKIGSKMGGNKSANLGADFVIPALTFDPYKPDYNIYDGTNEIPLIAAQLQQSHVGRLTPEYIDSTILEKAEKAWVLDPQSPIVDMIKAAPKWVGIHSKKDLDENTFDVQNEETGQSHYIVRAKIAQSANNLLLVGMKQMNVWEPANTHFQLHFIENPAIDHRNLTQEQLNEVQHIDAQIIVETQKIQLPSS